MILTNCFRGQIEFFIICAIQKLVINIKIETLKSLFIIFLMMIAIEKRFYNFDFFNEPILKLISLANNRIFKKFKTNID